MGQGNSSIGKLMDAAHEVVYTDEAKRLDPGQLHDDFGTTKFLLNSQSTLSLQRYLYHGATYPKNLSDAQVAYRAEKLVDKGYMDREHYEFILRTFVDVHNHTDDFMRKTLGTIQIWSGSIGVYGKTATRYFGYAHKTLTDLQAKMDAGPLTDAQIDGARKELQNLTKELHTHTQAIVDQCAALTTEILAFANLTSNDKTNMDTIVAQCLSSGGTLATNLKKKQDDLAYWQGQKSDAEGRYEQDKIIAGTTGTYIMVFPPFSTIAAIVVLGVYIARAVAAKDEMDNDDKMIIRDQIDIADALEIQTIVAHFTTEWKTCHELAASAMDAVTKVQGGFSNMLDALKEMNDADGLLDGIANDIISIALSELTDASNLWTHVQTVASNYKQYCLIEVKGPEESKAWIEQNTAGVTA